MEYFPGLKTCISWVKNLFHGCWCLVPVLAKQSRTPTAGPVHKTPLSVYFQSYSADNYKTSQLRRKSFLTTPGLYF